MRKRIRVKNFLIKASGFAAGLAWVIAACFADSDSIWPLRIVVFSTIWLLLLYIANCEE